MGRPKGLEPWRGVPMLRAHVDAASAAGLRVRVVLGPEVARHLEVLPPGVEIVWNAAWTRTDMATSASMGLQGLVWALVTPVDVPPPSPALLDALLRQDGPAVPTHDGRDGHPVRVHAEDDGTHPRARLDLRLQDARRVPVDDASVLGDLDTPEDWQTALSDARP